MEGLEKILLLQPLFHGLQAELGSVVAGCCRNVRFAAGAYLLHEGEAANEFFLIREGLVALEILAPGRKPAVLLTLGEGEIVGSSWLVPPYRWTLDARAVQPTHALGVDARCLRDKCEADHHLGYRMMQRFVPMLVRRLHATRLRNLDVYVS